MSKRMIKVQVDTNFARPAYEEYLRLPEGWDEWDEHDKDNYLWECANAVQEECVYSSAEVVYEDEM